MTKPLKTPGYNFIFLALLCAAGSGCTSTSVFSTDPDVTKDIAQATRAQAALITLYDGSKWLGKNVEARTDSTHWNADTVFVMYSELTGKDLPGQIFVTRSVATSSIRSIRISTPSTITGVFSGVAISCLAGVVADAILPNDIIDGFWSFCIGVGAGIMGGSYIGSSSGTLYTRDTIPAVSHRNRIHRQDTALFLVPGH